jgi:tRNA pseudouridine55 synthase
MDGLLVLDKPVGPTSHDVVARVRRLLGERRIGHTGTLDPAASGVLPLVVGRATRLARFLSGDDKEYEATIRLGVATDSGDAEGRPSGRLHEGPLPSSDAIDGALNRFRGSFLQQPPVFSAKKLAGRRSYALARSGSAGPAGDWRPAPVIVTTRSVQLLDYRDGLIVVRIVCSAGFYVRALAHDLGVELGVGAHVAALRRTRSGDLSLADAVPLADLEADPGRGAAALVPLARMLASWPSLTLTADGLARAGHGRSLTAEDFSGASGMPPEGERGHVRLLAPDGQLVALAEPEPGGLLHPSVVLM